MADAQGGGRVGLRGTGTGTGYESKSTSFKIVVIITFCRMFQIRKCFLSANSEHLSLFGRHQ